MKRDSEVDSVEVSTTVEASPALVFRIFTDAVRFSEWLGAAVSLDPVVGGVLRIDFVRHETIVSGEVKEIDPDRRIVFTWGVEGEPQAQTMPPGSTTVEVTLETVGESTVVTIRHQGLPTESEREDHQGGWQDYLGRLSGVL